MLRRRITKLPNLVNRKPVKEVKTAEENVVVVDVKNDTVKIPPEISESKIKVNQEKDEPKTIEVEYPPPPASPNKINRGRIKPVPRLGQRKISFSVHGSASESEDDNKRGLNRIRNDSVCSVASTTADCQNMSEVPSVPAKREFNNVIQRKCKRTEQSRKLAEARREFQMKFHKGKFDKQKLTMLDLIFYNPVTNPMSDKSKKNSESCELIEDKIEDPVNEDDPMNEDDPVPLSDKNESDEENTIPAPQIKIGADGEIIVDEKSLVIENKATKRDREALQATKLIDGDLSTAYGVYKRAKRAKDWSKEETLRFYKALNTLGTDFTIMSELFPGRNRRELKLKFKKEERMNRALIDRAIMQPIRFNIEELQLELNLDKKEQEDKVARQKEKERIRQDSNNKVTRKRTKNPLAGIFTKTNDMSDPKPLKRVKKKMTRAKTDEEYIKGGIASVLDESENSDDTEEKEYVTDQKPTKSGRIPKQTKTFTQIYEENEKRLQERKKNNESNATTEPGSILIISSKVPSGQLVYNVFMVTPPEENTSTTQKVLKNDADTIDGIENTSAVNIASSNDEQHVTATKLEDLSATNGNEFEQIRRDILDSDVVMEQ